ncbi:MAG: hypothetical protein WC342_06570 [Methanoregula sp.]|jgi:hypothetical protein
MKPGWKASLALVAMSLVFFSVILTPVIEISLRVLGTPANAMIILSSLLWNFTLLSSIALCGGLVFLEATQKENPSWYLGIPLVAAYVLIAMWPFLGQIFVIHDPSPPIYNPGGLCSLIMSYGTLFLLPPCAALFFWSQKGQGKWTLIMTGIAVVVTLNSLIVMSCVLSPAQPQYINGQHVQSEKGLLFLIMGYLIGLPAIGICILALAAFLWRDARRVTPPPFPRSAENP